MMKDNEKQIEEMAKIMHDRSREIAENPCGIALLLEQGKTLPDDYAEALYNANCRIFPEDSVVLSKEEYNELNQEWTRRMSINKRNYYLERRVSKEKVEKFANLIFEKFSYDKLTHESDEDIEIHLTASELFELAKQFVVEITTNDNCRYYDKANMRCNGAKCTPECYCNGYKSKCTEYSKT